MTGNSTGSASRRSKKNASSGYKAAADKIAGKISGEISGEILSSPKKVKQSQEVPVRVERSMSTAPIEAARVEDWITLQPSGIVVLPGNARPVFLLKEEKTGDTLPVWMHPLDASIALHELGQGGVGSPHLVVRQILDRLSVKSVDCFINERVGHHQYLTIVFKDETGKLPADGPLRVRADEAISFCIANRARFFSTKAFIAQCRVLNEELDKLQEGLLSGAATQAFPELEIDSKKTGYMM